jgi:5'-nucleotidase / UDP-sugar diphosphatase
MKSNQTQSYMSSNTISRRKFLAGTSAAVAGLCLSRPLYASASGKKIFTILHTNDMHSAFIGLGPSSDYTPFTLNDDATHGGFSRLATLIKKRKIEHQNEGPVLILDAGDYSMGTAFGAATREIGAELRLMAMMGYDSTTFGNHEFDYGPEGLGKSIGVAAKSGRIPAILSSNTDFSKDDVTLADLSRLSKSGTISSHQVIERGGIRFGIFGVLGKEAIFYTNGGAVKFPDAIESAKEMVKVLRDSEKVDVVIALSHGGVAKGKDGQFSIGDDVHLAEEVPGIDIVIGGHSHTELHKPIIVDGRTPVVQTGKEGRNLGELVVTLADKRIKVESYQLYPIDDSIQGDKDISDEIDKYKKLVTGAVFSSRGYSVDQPLAIAPKDLPNTFTDITASTLLANLCTDAFRKATKAHIGFTANGLLRAGISRGKSGLQTVYDVFAVAPLGYGVVDTTAGSALVTGYFTGQELKNMLEFFLVDNPTHPGEYFPRASGMRFHYDTSRPKFDAVTAIELGDFDKGYKAIDITGKDSHLYSLTCPLMLGVIIVAIPKYTKGALTLVAKNKEGKVLTSRVEALDPLEGNSGYLLPPHGSLDKSSVDTVAGKEAVREIKEWQAIMDFMKSLPVTKQGEIPVIPVDNRAAEVRAIKLI